MHTGVFRPLFQAVGVYLGDDMLLPFRLHDGADLVLVHDLHVVAFIHGQAQRLVLGHGEGLFLVAYFLGVAVPAAGTYALGAVVILKRFGSQALDMDGLHAGKLHVQAVVKEAVGLGCLVEALHQGGLVLFVKMNGYAHKFPP